MGVRSIPIKDMIKYRRLVKSCAESGDSNLAEQLELMDLERDFKRSKSMANWTSTHAMFSVVTVGYYFMAKILNIPYDVTFFFQSRHIIFSTASSLKMILYLGGINLCLLFSNYLLKKVN